MAKTLHIDIETYSSEDLRKVGVYKYIESEDFEIILLAYALDEGPIKIVDLLQGERIPKEFIDAYYDDRIEKHAHNANFERVCLTIGYGMDIPLRVWRCSAVKSLYCGYPMDLDQASKVLKLESEAKLSTGKALIRYFCMPVKPTKTNGQRTRNYPEHNLEKWEEFKEYNKQDVVAERALLKKLEGYEMPKTELELYFLDQKINDEGIRIDIPFVKNIIKLDKENSKNLSIRLKELTELENPNSPAQLKEWLSEALNEEVTTLAKDAIPELIEKAGAGPVREVLELRQKSARTSIKKYLKMLLSVNEDERVRGLFQYYGASKTGRWAGRRVQVQNLPRTYLENLELVRELFKNLMLEDIDLLYESVSDTLSQLTRTAFIPSKNKRFFVADLSAIEARVTAWFAEESWRLEVFKTHGKIYEASASLMFGVPLEEIGKGSDLRQKGKVAELALGYQGALGAMVKMGGEDMGLSESEMRTIVKKWRAKSPNIVRLWSTTEKAALRAVKTGKTVTLKQFKGLEFSYDGKALSIKLPSGRKLFYPSPSIYRNRWDKEALRYMGLDQTTRQWKKIEMYGGKFVENIVQAFSRDILADIMLRLDKKDFNIVMHVHDEVILDIYGRANDRGLLEFICEEMSRPISWAPDLVLAADGYISEFYKKD